MLLLGLGPLCPLHFHGYVACPVGIRILVMVRDRVNIQLLFPSRWAKEYDMGGNKDFGISSMNCLACCLPLGDKSHPKMQASPQKKTLTLASNKVCKKQKRTQRTATEIRLQHRGRQFSGKSHDIIEISIQTFLTILKKAN